MTGWMAAVLLAAAVVVWWPPPTSPPRDAAARSVPSWGRIVGAGRRTRLAADQAAVLEVCDLLAAELAAGRPPGAALGTAADRWPPLVAAVEAVRLGADVPDVLRRLSEEHRGAADLRWVAGAWRVAQRSGHGLAAALERTADGLRSRRRTRRLVDSELASARATARLVACLPLAVLVMGTGAGSDPWSFLVRTPVGWGCLVAGLALIALGLWWIEQLADRASAP